MTNVVNMEARSPHNGRVLDEVEAKLRTWSAVTPDGAMVSLQIICTPTVARETARELRQMRALAGADVDHQIAMVANRMKRAQIDRWEQSLFRPFWLALALTMLVMTIVEQAGLLP